MEILHKINAAVWGTPTLLLIFFTGIILTLRTNFFQFRFFWQAVKTFFGGSADKNQNRLTPLQSASTALAATMGTGNIIGVAGAISLGGPGAVFWMWVSAAVCMIIKFAEIALAVHYRETTPDGSYTGGAMYYIKNALPQFLSPLATIFCICGIAASFGVGNMTQINTIAVSISSIFKSVFCVSHKLEFFIKLVVGVICAVVCHFVLKSDRSIGRFCEKIIPVMTIIYIVLTIGAIAYNRHKIPAAFKDIFISAFNPKAVTGGAIGSAFIGVRFGMSRGVFSNEAGLGTAPIAYACSDGNQINLGLMGIMEVFIDTVVVCTLTALTLLCAGDICYGTDGSSTLTLNALRAVYGRNVIFIFCPVVCLFAFSSTIGWGLYGTKFITFLLGEKSKCAFLTFFTMSMIPAAIFSADAVWIIAEIFNGLMAIPNISALLLLSNKISDITYTYKNNPT